MADTSARDKAWRAYAEKHGVVEMVGVPAYHDYRQQKADTTDAMYIRRGVPPKPAVGAGKGFKGWK